jgi:hypothetical protein
MAKSIFKQRWLKDWGIDLENSEIIIILGAIFLIGRLVFHVW